MSRASVRADANTAVKSAPSQVTSTFAVHTDTVAIAPTHTCLLLATRPNVSCLASALRVDAVAVARAIIRTKFFGTIRVAPVVAALAFSFDASSPRLIFSASFDAPSFCAQGASEARHAEALALKTVPVTTAATTCLTAHQPYRLEYCAWNEISGRRIARRCMQGQTPFLTRQATDISSERRDPPRGREQRSEE